MIEVLREPGAFDERVVRRLRAFVRRAIQAGSWRQREADWLDRTIASGRARAVLRDGELIGFFSLRSERDDKLGPIVYGSACLWRTSEAGAEQAVHDAVIVEGRRLAAPIYGFRFRDNAEAARFYAAERGWQVVDVAAFPACVLHEVGPHLDEVHLVRHRLAENPDSGDRAAPTA